MEHTHDRLHHRHARNALPDPEAIANAAADALAKAEQTLVSIVYVTASKTFDGPVGGYTTLGVSAVTTSSDTPAAVSSTPTSTADAKSSSAKSSDADSSFIVADTTTQAKSKSSSIIADTTLRTSSTGLPSSVVPTSSAASSLAIAAATSSLSTSRKSSTISSTASAASSTSSASSSSGGMSAGGKAGLAIGILLLFGTVLAIVLFCFKKRKNAMKAERLDDEKTDMFAAAGPGRAASTRTTATAPRLSLRPITQFLPNLGEKRQSRGNVLAMASTPISQSTEPRKTGSAWERPMLSQDSNRNNPFGNHAETIDATNANGPAVVESVGPGGEIISGAAAGPVAAGAIGLARGASKRENQPKQIDFTKGGPFRGPPSPASTDFSVSSDSPGTPTQTPQGAAIAAAGGPANSVVHRVQLDFKPSMEDELELRAGQLIRLLHEYDDGWAFCIRLDRSRQGVVPRTCLSTRPVKPRPQQNGPRRPPPPGMRVPQQGRPMNQGSQGRPMSPAMNQGPPRAMSPAGNRPTTPQGRPMTPTGPGPQKQMTPQNQGRPRSPSAAQMQGQRNSPPGPSPMNSAAQPDVADSAPLSRSPPNDGPISRKPVGQAL